MSKERSKAKVDRTLLPSQTGYQEISSTLCIGLDIAWFGGSEGDPRSKYDFLAAAFLNPALETSKIGYLRVPLNDHDLDAAQTSAVLKNLIEEYVGRAHRIVLAIDAPLQAIDRDLPKRMPRPKRGNVQRRACDVDLNWKRKEIDSLCGGAQEWHPNIQPGAPLAPRVECLLDKLSRTFVTWTREHSDHPHLIIECFPAEAIWAAKRMGWFAPEIRASDAKEYKNKKGKRLTAMEVERIIQEVLLPFRNVCAKICWNTIVREVLSHILADSGWRDGESYRGGKMLDDVVDSMLCLATAISYAVGNAHVWQDRDDVDDGHIIGPGVMHNHF